MCSFCAVFKYVINKVVLAVRLNGFYWLRITLRLYDYKFHGFIFIPILRCDADYLKKDSYLLAIYKILPFLGSGIHCQLFPLLLLLRLLLYTICIFFYIFVLVVKSLLYFYTTDVTNLRGEINAFLFWFYEFLINNQFCIKTKEIKSLIQ